MISVCFPYWHRQEALNRLAVNYRALYGDMALEFSVCDDGSIPPMQEPWSQWDRLGPFVITRNVEEGKKRPLNPCVPINMAIQASHGEVIVLTNPEVTHPQRLLPAMLALLENELDYVSCPVKDTRGPWVAGPETKYGTRGRLPLPPGADVHFLVMFHRALFERAGGFDEEYRHGQGGDDNDWVWRAYAAGARFRTVEGLHAVHTPSHTHWGLPSNAGLFYRKWPDARRRALLKERGDL